MLPIFAPKSKDDLVLGRTGKHRFFPKFTVSPQVRQFHTYVVGLTGRGKSKFLQNCLVQDILAGRGCAVIDPHGDLVKDVLRSLISLGYFDSQAAFEKVIYVHPHRRDYVIPFNVLAKDDPDTHTHDLAQRVITTFKRVWWEELRTAPRFEQIMRSSLATLIETGEPLTSLYRLIVDDEFRITRLQQISDAKVAADCQRFFTSEFDQWRKQDRLMMSASTTNKASALVENPYTFFMLGQKDNSLPIRQIMDEGKVLLIDLGGCNDETKKLLGTFIFTGFEQAALSRARAPQETRKPYYLYVDEFQDFAVHPGASQTFKQMLSQVRKFGLYLTLANQGTADLSPGLQMALKNAQTIVAFRISRDDAEALSRVLKEVDIEAIKRESQTDIQHPAWLSLFDQWEVHIRNLTAQQVRQAAVKTADDRSAIIWPEKLKSSQTTQAQLEEAIIGCLQKHGHPYDDVYQSLVKTPQKKVARQQNADPDALS